MTSKNLIIIKKKPILIKFISLFKKPRNEIKNILKNNILHYINTIILSKPHLLDFSISYQPDSQIYYKSYPDFPILFRKFTQYNKINNGGDTPRLWAFILNINQIIEENIEGDFAELGVWRGNTASVLAHIASKYNKKVYLFDTYEGFDVRDLKNIDSQVSQSDFSDTSLSLVKSVIGENIKNCEFIKGYFPESIQDKHKSIKYSVVSLDCDLYEPMKKGLDFFYPLLSKGGLLLLHDYSSKCWAGAKLAIDEFCKENNEFVILMPDKSGSAFIRKSQW